MRRGRCAVCTDSRIPSGRGNLIHIREVTKQLQLRRKGCHADSEREFSGRGGIRENFRAFKVIVWVSARMGVGQAPPGCSVIV